MKLFVESYPKLITTSSLGSALPIDDQWNIVVEAYATKHCYMKLQQTEMAIIWNDMYNREKASITRMENDKQGHNIQVSDNLISVSEPALNPLVGRWN
jgi:hypothetical protein